MALSLILPISVTLFGLYMLIKLRAFFIIHPIKTVTLFKKSLVQKKNRTSLYLALAGTLGVGNIFGVAAGITLGGAGSVFWLLISAFFSMVIKYCETTLAEREGELGRGTHFAIKGSFKKSGNLLSKIYAVLCLGLAFFMGASLQTKAIYDSFDTENNISLLFLVFFAVLIAISVLGGIDNIEKITAIIIPLTTIIYILLSLSVIIINFEMLDDAVISVVNSAISPKALGGGMLGFFTSSAIKEGYSRGILSNEAGLGTSALAHSRSDKRLPALSGLYGMCEVFFDTVILCPLTAFMILTVNPNPADNISPMQLISEAVSTSLGKPFSYLLSLLILSFGYSTVTCWYYYGTECANFLFGKSPKGYFLVLYIVFIALGVYAHNTLLLYLTDLIILFMTLIMTVLILKEQRFIIEETEKVFKNKTGNSSG